MSASPPTPSGIPPEELTAFSAASNMVMEFEGLLDRYGIQIRKGSDLEHQCLAIAEWEDIHARRVPFDPHADHRDRFAAGLGALHLIRLLIEADARCGLDPLAPHLQLLNKAVIAQSTHATSSDANNKLFELMLGAICLNFATSVTLDDPQQSKGNNPDVLFDHGGTRWGLACKVPGGRSPLTLFERVEEGVAQIERSPADSGFVVVNLRNQIPHEEFSPRQHTTGQGTSQAWGVFQSADDAFAQLLRVGCRRFRDVLDMNDPKNVVAIFTGKRTQPGVLLFLQTMCFVGIDSKPVPTRLQTFHLWEVGECDDSALEMLTSLNLALHHRL